MHTLPVNPFFCVYCRLWYMPFLEGMVFRLCGRLSQMNRCWSSIDRVSFTWYARTSASGIVAAAHTHRREAKLDLVLRCPPRITTIGYFFHASITIRHEGRVHPAPTGLASAR